MTARRNEPKQIRKRAAAAEPAPPAQGRERVDCQRLAEDLVQRRLAPPTILGRALRRDEISLLREVQS